MKRGDLVTVAMPGAFGKPRPAVVVQADGFEGLDSVTFLPLSSNVLPEQVFRVTVGPTSINGLREVSQILADKCSTLRLNKVGPVFGRLSDQEMAQVDRALAVFLGFI
ncbi:type II toxin-antitoxin system PemK/MazF family toxin [soil metagenome]